MDRTPEQRRAYIDTSRRLQPHAELERKAHKAKGRTFSGVERTDLNFARHHGWDLHWRESRRWLFAVTFCSLCHKFAPAVGELVEHVPRCSANPIDDGPYPGWTAAGGAPKNPSPSPAIASPGALRAFLSSPAGGEVNPPRPIGTPISQLSGRPGHPGFEEFCRIASSWGFD